MLVCTILMITEQEVLALAAPIHSNSSERDFSKTVSSPVKALI